MITHAHSPSDCYDVAVVGAGPAGSALAALLARAGRSVVLLDKDSFPRDKLCGEFLSSEAQVILEELGCLEMIRALKPASITHVRFTSGSGRVVQVTLPGSGMGVSRLAFDYLLLRHADACGATVCTDTRVQQITPSNTNADQMILGVLSRGASEKNIRHVRANLVIGAYGRRDRLDRQLERQFIQLSHPFIGLKRHHRPSSPTASERLVAEFGKAVEIHTFDGGYCGLNFIETGEVNVCMLLHQRFLRRQGTLRWEQLISSLREINPLLRQRLDALDPSDHAIHAVAQIPFSKKELAIDRVLFVGDAAGMITPLCGDGQAMALESALLLSNLILSLPPKLSSLDVQRLTTRWNYIWQREFTLRMHVGRWLQAIFLRPRIANATARFFQVVPPLATLLTRVTRGS